MEKLYTISDLEEIFQCERTKLYREMKAGKLKYTQFGYHRRFTQEQLDEYIERNRIEGKEDGQ